MSLLVQTHPGCPRQSPESRKMVVVVVGLNGVFECIFKNRNAFDSSETTTTILWLCGPYPGQSG